MEAEIDFQAYYTCSKVKATDTQYLVMKTE